MGWISDRKMKTGTSLNSNKGRKYSAPLRKVVQMLSASDTMFGADTVELECGHVGKSWGGDKARCKKCEKGLPADIKE